MLDVDGLGRDGYTPPALRRLLQNQLHVERSYKNRNEILMMMTGRESSSSSNISIQSTNLGANSSAQTSSLSNTSHEQHV